MKKLSTLRVALVVISVAVAPTLTVGQLFQQDFSSSTTVSDYVSVTPSNGQMNAISTSGAGTVVSINTTGSNKLRFTRTGNAGSYSRTTDFSPLPTSLMYRFDLTVSGNSAAQTNAAVWQVGSGYGTANAAETNANTYARIGLNWTATAGQFSIRNITAGTNSGNFSGTQTITWVVNNSGATLTYRAPDGSNESVANDVADIWIGTTRSFNDVAVETASQTLADLKFAFNAGNATVDIDNILINPIPAVPTSDVALPINANDFTARWATVTGVTGYSIDVATDASFTSFVSGYNNLYVAGQSTNSVSVTGLSPSTPYWYRVRGTNEYTVGSFSGGNSASQNPTTTAGGTNTSVQFAAASSSADEDGAPVALTINVTDPDPTVATEITISAAGATGRVTSFTTPVTAAGAATTGTCTVTLDDNLICDGNENVTFTITAVTGGQGTATIGAQATHVMTVVDDDICPNTSVQFVSTSSSVAESVGTTNLVLAITDFDASNATSVTITATGATGRITGFTTPVVFPANDGSNQNCTVSIDNNVLCEGNQNVTFTITAISGGQGTAFIGGNNTHVLTITDDDVCPELVVAPSTLNFGAAPIGGSGSSQSFNLSGTDLSGAPGSITVNAPNANFQVSNDDATWGSSTTIPYATATLSATPVYARATPQSAGAQSGNVTLSGGGDVAPPTVALSATGVDPQIYWSFGTAGPTVDALSNVGTSALSQGNNNGTTTLLTILSASFGYTGASGTNNAGAAAVTGALNPSVSTYFQFTLTPTTGYAIAINTIRFGSRSTSTGPQSYSIRWSLDGYTSDLVTGAMANNSTWALEETIGLNLVSPAGVAVTYRIYGHNGTGSAALNTANWRIDDLDLRGEAILPAAAYYSQSNGAVNDAIWSTTPVGTPGPAIWSPSASMIVQEGDTITVNSNTNVDDLTLEISSRLNVGAERLFSIHGTSVVLAQNSVGSGTGEVELVGPDAVTVTVIGLVTFNNLTVNTPSGTSVTGTLDIRGTLLLADGDFDATGATVRLRSNAARTGHLGPVGATADYIGNLTTQRFIPEGVTNWRLLGSAVAGRTVADWDDDFITAGFPGSNYPTFDQPQGSGILWPSVRVYDETDPGTDELDGLNGVSGIAQALTPGQGFAVWCGDALGGTEAFVVDVVGEPTLAKTPLSLPVTFTNTSTPAVDGWNLVSNPLPSAVDFSAITRGTDLFDGYYIYDPVSGSSASWDEDLGISVPTGVLNGVIQSSQAFWLKAGGSDVATSVVESNKISANTGGVFGGVADGAVGVPLIRLTMTGSTGSWSDQAVVAFVAGTPALDVKDAMKLAFAHASAPRIATRTTDGYDLIINRYGTSTGNITIPVTVRVPITGAYSITVAISGTDALTCYTLEDLLTGTVTPVTDGSVYSFSMDATESIVADRFVLRSSTALPYNASPALCGGTATGQVAVQVPEGPVDLTLMDAFGNLVQEANNVAAGEFIFTDLLAGNYTVSVGNSSACGTVSAPAVVLEPFALEASINAQESTCGTAADGRVDVSILGGEAPYTYFWSTGSTEEAITGIAGTYSLVVTDATGCNLSIETAIPAGPGPEALFETMAEPVLINQPVLFTNLSTPDANYLWDLGDGSSSTDFDVTHSYALPGVYTVVLMVNDGDCAASFSQEISVQLTTSTSATTASPFLLNAWSAGDQLIVEHGFDHGKAVQIDVLDATGRLHMQRQVGGTPARVSIPASTLSTGIWFVRITSGQVQQSFRVPVVR